MATQPEKTDKPEQSGDLAAFPALEIDWDLYGEMLQECDWPEDKKKEFVEALISIVVTFVDIGFGIHPVQQAVQAGKRDLSNGSGSKSRLSEDGSAVLSGTPSKSHSLRENFGKGACK